MKVFSTLSSFEPIQKSKPKINEALPAKKLDKEEITGNAMDGNNINWFNIKELSNNETPA